MSLELVAEDFEKRAREMHEAAKRVTRAETLTEAQLAASTLYVRAMALEAYARAVKEHLEAERRGRMRLVAP